jgi:lipopolysaccharide export system ATP-binding protein
MSVSSPEDSLGTGSSTPRHRLCTEGLIKDYGSKRVVNGVSLEVSSGEIVGLLGPNGAGKTTTFYMTVGLVKPTSGRILLDNQDISSLPMHKRGRIGLGYLPQETSVFRKLSVEQNLMAFAETLPLNRKDRLDRVDHFLHDLGLTHLRKQRAYTLSGGERRRLEIARALLLNPGFLLMDEPFSGVDPISVQEVQKLILSLRERGIGILITDHNVRETLRVVDRAYLLHEGKILSAGNSDFLIQDPASRKFYLGENFLL